MKRIIEISLAAILAFSAPLTYGIKYQSHESIKSAAVDFIVSRIPYEDYHIVAADVDRRLQLPICGEQLQAFTQAKAIKLGRISVGVRCNGPSPWTIYNPVNLKVYQHVIALRQQVRRGEILNRQHLQLQKVELSRTRQGYYTDMQALLDLQVTRNLTAGTVLLQKHVTEPLMVARGQKVIISADGTAMKIQMAGLALMDGVLGQRIRVKNEKSQRIVEGVVSQPGRVTVDF